MILFFTLRKDRVVREESPPGVEISKADTEYTTDQENEKEDPKVNEMHISQSYWSSLELYIDSMHVLHNISNTLKDLTLSQKFSGILFLKNWNKSNTRLNHDNAKTLKLMIQLEILFNK